MTLLLLLDGSRSVRARESFNSLLLDTGCYFFLMYITVYTYVHIRTIIYTACFSTGGTGSYVAKMVSSNLRTKAPIVRVSQFDSVSFGCLGRCEGRQECWADDKTISVGSTEVDKNLAPRFLCCSLCSLLMPQA